MEPIASTNAIVVTMEVLVNLNQVIIPEEQEVDLGHYYIQHLRIFCTKLSRSIKWEFLRFFGELVMYTKEFNHVINKKHELFQARRFLSTWKFSLR